jgi:ATP-dependent RNA helicase DeaD
MLRKLLFFRRKKSDEPASEAGTSSVAVAPPSAVAVALRTAEPANRPPSAPAATSEAASHRRRSRGSRTRNHAENATASPVSPVSHAVSHARLPEPLIPLPEAFRALGVDETGLRAIAAFGFDTPTPIQEQTLGILYDGEDVVGLAQTGTGKTLAFGLPLARIVDPSVLEVQAVIMVPTRELAKQVHDHIDFLGRFYGFTTLGLIGGGRVRTDLMALERGAHVVVGTPGRVIDHMKRGTLSLAKVRFAVLDEADQMLDIGFARDIDYILRVTPKNRQTALFSATMPESIGRLVYRYMRGARRVSVSPEQRTVESVDQFYCEISERDKFLALRHLYETRDLGRSLIFRRTKIGVDRLTESLQRVGIGAEAIHGDLRQSQRDRVMGEFRSGTLQFLIATNVAARGLDIPDIEHVINFDVPQNAEEYIHRIGRTARAGKHGSAYTFVGEWELDEWDRIKREVGNESDMQYLAMPAHWD